MNRQLDNARSLVAADDKVLAAMDESIQTQAHGKKIHVSAAKQALCYRAMYNQTALGGKYDAVMESEYAEKYTFSVSEKQRRANIRIKL